jgi:hypothetical protein
MKHFKSPIFSFTPVLIVFWPRAICANLVLYKARKIV